MFECSCIHIADRHPQWARRVQAGRSWYAASYDMLVQAIHAWALCLTAFRAAYYEFAVACLTQTLYGAPSPLAPAYAEALEAHAPQCRMLSDEEWCDAVTIVLREARRRAADTSTSSGAAAAWPTDVHVD